MTKRYPTSSLGSAIMLLPVTIYKILKYTKENNKELYIALSLFSTSGSIYTLLGIFRAGSPFLRSRAVVAEDCCDLRLSRSLGAYCDATLSANAPSSLTHEYIARVISSIATHNLGPS